MYRLKQQKASEEMLKYLYEVLKGLHQRLTFFFLFGRNKDFLNEDIHFHLTWKCSWQHAFLRNMNPYRSLTGFALNLPISYHENDMQVAS